MIRVMDWMARHVPLLEKVLIGVLVAAFFAVALYLRIALPYDTVFGASVVKCTGVDAYWHMRIVDNLVHNFPHLNSFDPYMLYPGGGGTNALPFFDYLLAGIIWIVGLGSPSHHVVDVIAVYFPAVLGALLVVPVYFIGKTLFNRWAGVIAAGLIAITPGDFLGRSILGFTDHHIAEALLATTSMLFLMLAVKNAKREPLTLAHLRHPNETSTAKPIFYSILAGVFLGIYLGMWMGALLFVFIIAVYFVVLFVFDHLRQRATDYLCLVGATTFLTALVVFVFVSRNRLTVAALVIAVLIPLALLGASRLMSSRGLRPIYYPLALVGLALVAGGLFCAIDYSLLKSMLGELDVFTWPSGSTVMEMQPVLRGDNGGLTFSIIWRSYGYSLLFAMVALGLLVYLLVKRSEADKVLLLVWTLVIVAATLAQRRFNYYLAVNVAVLAGYPAWQVLRFAGLKDDVRASDVPRRVPKKKAKLDSKKRFGKREFRLRASHLYVALTAAVLCCVFTIVPISREEKTYGAGYSYTGIIDVAKDTAKAARFAPSEAWCESLNWLSENTTEPFGDADFYYARYEDRSDFDYSAYPEAYGVTSWWDYGYWIIRIGHRIPSVNPGGQTGILPKVASLLLAQDEAAAISASDDLGSRYVIVDNLMSVTYFDWQYTRFVRGKFSAIVDYTDHQYNEFYDIFYQRQEGKTSLGPVMLYFPEYYRTLCVRLYCFGGAEVEPESCTVVSWTWEKAEGIDYREIPLDGMQTFDTYEKALDYIDTHSSGEYNYSIVSADPTASAVPLDALQHYESAYDSELTVAQMRDLESSLQTIYGYGGEIPAVRIFEYVK